MVRGIGAAIFVTSLVLSMSVLGGLGFYSMVGAVPDASGQNADVQRAAEQLEGVEFGEGRSGSILQGPLAAVTPVVDMFLTLKTVVANTSGVLQLLFGLPEGVADTIQTLFLLALVITAIYLIRSGSPV